MFHEKFNQIDIHYANTLLYNVFRLEELIAFEEDDYRKVKEEFTSRMTRIVQSLELDDVRVDVVKRKDELVFYLISKNPPGFIYADSNGSFCHLESVYAVEKGEIQEIDEANSNNEYEK